MPRTSGRQSRGKGQGQFLRILHLQRFRRKKSPAAGSSGSQSQIERAFQDAPPMIPHALTGLIPITAKSNMCISCHMPEVAEAVGAVPLPISHLTRFRPEVKKKGNVYEVVNIEGITKKDLDGKLSMAIYNCTLCHVPQADVTVDIKNKFEAVFKSKDGKTKSSLSKTYYEGTE